MVEGKDLEVYLKKEEEETGRSGLQLISDNDTIKWSEPMAQLELCNCFAHYIKHLYWNLAR